MKIRRLEEKDNMRVAEIVRLCLTEYGYAGRMDSAWGDPFLEHFSEVYVLPNNGYWVAVDDTDTVVAGVGIGPLDEASKTCELQKMYCIPEYRGTGIAQQLLDWALDFAGKHYKACYLETFDTMKRARSFYEKNGFTYTTETIGHTGHSGCGCHYIKNLK